MYRNKVYLKYKKERAILSDVLPYEIPVTFSNRFIYKYLARNNIEYSDQIITWRKRGKELDELIKIIFGLER